MLSIAIPIGPNKTDVLYLEECLESIRNQTVKPSEIIFIDDMAYTKDWRGVLSTVLARGGLEETRITHIDNPWRLGVGASFNVGVALASYDLVLMLGADDSLMPNCVERCIDMWNKTVNSLGYYHLDVQYYDGEVQNLPCNAAMVHKRLWNHTGGFAPETGVGAPDAAFISVLLTHQQAGTLIRVNGGSLYKVRRHKDQDTAKRGPYLNAIHIVRDVLTRSWSVPDWGRFV